MTRGYRSLEHTHLIRVESFPCRCKHNKDIESLDYGCNGHRKAIVCNEELNTSQILNGAARDHILESLNDVPLSYELLYYRLNCKNLVVKLSKHDWSSQINHFNSMVPS